MSDLLVVTRLKSQAMQHKGNVPLFLEYRVSPETAPYLVSSTSSVMWVLESHPGDMVRAAVRQMTTNEFFREVIDAVVGKGREMDWGNVHPLTLDGVHAAIKHIEYYDQGPIELLVPRSHQKTPPSDGASVSSNIHELIMDTGLPFRLSSWVPNDTIVVVPKDRYFVGNVDQVTAKKIAGVVHNVARGMAIIQDPR